MPKYSIIIPYRGREAHLQVLLPRLHELFQNKDYEIIISEQNDDNNFQIACVENIGFQHATGDVIVLHQVDYYPTDDVSYDIQDQPILPARRAVFLDEKMEPRDFNDIPAGYRHFLQEIDDNFYGGVIVMTRKQFEDINGINPVYKGWGNEDEDLRERLKWAGYKPIRNAVGTYLCLYHVNGGDFADSQVKHNDFLEGRKLLSKAYELRHIGYRNLSADVETFDTGLPNTKWIKSTNYNITENEASIS